MSPVEPDSPPDRLDGWKDIASYLNKSVRSAIRWEQKLGLPVRRIHGKGGEIVFAFRSEIDAWLRTQKTANEDSSSEPPVPPVAAAPDAPLASNAGWRRGLLTGLAAASSVAILALTGFLHLKTSTGSGSTAGPVMQLKVEGDTLFALDRVGTVAWKKEFPGLLTREYESKVPEDFEETRVVQDLDGNGQPEVLFKRAADKSADNVLYCFDSRGHPRFVHTGPTTSVRFGDETSLPPFGVSNFLVVSPPGKPTTIWTASIHHRSFPSAIRKLDVDGHVLGTFWTNGHARTLGYGRVEGRDIMLVGGTNNETGMASLIVLDYDKPDGSAPASKAKFVCKDCPAGGPIAFVLFPRTEIGSKANGPIHVYGIEFGEQISVDVLQASRAFMGGQSADVHYRLDQHFRPVNGEFGHAYLAGHAMLEKAGTLGHAFDASEIQQLFPVLRWSGSSFVKFRLKAETTR